MFYQLAINFCILFTFSVLSYWPFQDRVRFRVPLQQFHPYLIGTMAGITGLFLLRAAVPIAEGVIVDARLPVIILSGVFGGPIAPMVSSVMIGLARIWSGHFAEGAMIAGINTMVIGLIAATIFSRWSPTFRNARFVFHFTVFQTAAVIVYIQPPGTGAWLNIILFLGYSYLSFFTVAFILRELNTHFRKLEGVEQLSKTDYLTGLSNNRTFGEQVQTFTARQEGPVSLILLDIDRFKAVNDTYGHPAGDEVLRELAKRMKRISLPDGAVLSRNGGEEFSILLPGVIKEKGTAIAEQVRCTVADNPFIVDGGLSLPITISLGVCTFPDDASGAKELYERADQALYRAKESGRNLVVTYGPQPVP